MPPDGGENALDMVYTGIELWHFDISMCRYCIDRNVQVRQRQHKRLGEATGWKGLKRARYDISDLCNSIYLGSTLRYIDFFNIYVPGTKLRYCDVSKFDMLTH